MCGRYALTVEPETLFGTFAAEPDSADPGGGVGGPAAPYGGDAPHPRYNIAPTVTVPVVRLDPRRAPDSADGPGRRQIEPMRWGLVPSWAKDVSVGNRMFNARAESLADKPAFRRALAKRRCLIPASGWFEWRILAERAGAGRKVPKQAYYLTPQDGSVLAFAGLWEYWKAAGDPDAPAVVSMTIVTTASVGPLRDIHERMPLVLPAAEWSDWLDPDVDTAPLLTPTPAALVEALELRPVGRRVGSVANDDADLLRRVEPDHPASSGPPAAAPDGSSGDPTPPPEQLALDFPNPR